MVAGAVIVDNTAMRNFIDKRKFEVGAGFIPAHGNIRNGLRAGINPAPTKKSCRSVLHAHRRLSLYINLLFLRALRGETFGG